VKDCEEYSKYRISSLSSMLHMAVSVSLLVMGAGIFSWVSAGLVLNFLQHFVPWIEGDLRQEEDEGDVSDTESEYSTIISLRATPPLCPSDAEESAGEGEEECTLAAPQPMKPFYALKNPVYGSGILNALTFAHWGAQEGE